MKIAIIGFGLIGSSIAKAIKNSSKQSDFYIIGYDLTNPLIQQSLLEVKNQRLIDQVGSVDYRDLNQADLIVLCVPVGKMVDVFEKIKANARDGAIITDCGSTKKSVVDDANQVFGHLPDLFVPAHPLAGSEITGFNSGRAELFKNKVCLISASENTNPKAIETVEKFWSMLGAKIKPLNLANHDHLLAQTSHLPHLISYCLINGLLDCDENILDFASSGFADLSRLASSDPDLWIDIFMHNRKELFTAISNLESDLTKAKQMLIAEDKEALKKYFLRAKKARDSHIKKYPDIFKSL